MSYPKIYRIPVPSFKEVNSKHYLSLAEVEELLDGLILIEEKIDGKIGAEDRENLECRLFFELMKYKHTIPYLKLPSWNIYFDVFLHNEKRFADLEVRNKILISLGLPVVRRIYYGKVNSYEELLEYLPKLLSMKSVYGDETIEGIVIKNYQKQLFGKIVNPQFEEKIGDIHWTKKPICLNRLSL